MGCLGGKETSTWGESDRLMMYRELCYSLRTSSWGAPPCIMVTCGDLMNGRVYEIGCVNEPDGRPVGSRNQNE